MINRYRRIQPNLNTQYLPQVQQDFVPDLSGLEQVLGKVQAEYDATQKPFELPNYLRSSPTDVDAFNEYRRGLEDSRAAAIQSFKDGNIAEGSRALKDIQNKLLSAKQPGGVHFELERGVSEYNSALKELQKTYNDPKSPTYNPYLFRMAKDRLDAGIDDFKDSTGQYRAGISGPVLDKYIPQEEMVNQLDKIIDNIEADQIVFGGTNVADLKGVSFKGLLERGELESIDRNKVASVLINSITPEMLRSIQQEGKAMGLSGDQSQILNAKGDDFANTTMGRMIKGLVESKTYRRVKDKSKVVADQMGLELFKHGLKKKEIDYEFNLGSETLRSQVFTYDGLPKAERYKVDKNGNVGTTSELMQTPRGSIVVHKRESVKKGFRDYLQSVELINSNPTLHGIYKKFEDETVNMDNKKLHKFIMDKYEDKKKKMSVSDITYNVYGDKVAKKKKDILFGPGSTGLGNIVNKTLIVQEQGKPPQQFTVKQLMDQYNIKDVEQFKKNSFVLGNVQSTNPLAASGEQIVWTNPKNGKNIQFSASDMSLEDAAYKASDFELASVAYNGNKDESAFVFTGVPELDQHYGQIQARGRDVYESDQLMEQLTNPNIDDKTRKELVDRLTVLERRPEEDKFVKRKVDLYNKEGRLLSQGPNGLYLKDIAKLKEELLNNARSNN